MSNYDLELDTSGLNCPIPIMRVNKAFTDLASGHILKITSTDPGSIKDFAAFCRNTDHELVSNHQEGHRFVYFIKKIAAS